MARQGVQDPQPRFASSLPRARGVQRKLGRDHLAFLRGALEGLPLAPSSSSSLRASSVSRSAALKPGPGSTQAT